ncbi:MAG TPA: RHS repeat-associated core domain-containing protein [Methylomirabilota bacterium]|nr:RHS repeat-associated core domain-containing protein [Methylomirabilota bacterium]
MTSGSTLTYFHSDHLGWRASTNTSAQIVGQQGSYPYGENWYSQNGNAFMFTSYQYDTQSALYYAMARWYDASAGRFCSADPVGGNPEDPQSWNRYPYSRNDPIDLADPSGKSFWSWLIHFIEAIFTGAFPGRTLANWNPFPNGVGPWSEQPPFPTGGVNLPGGGVISESGGFGNARANPDGGVSGGGSGGGEDSSGYLLTIPGLPSRTPTGHKRDESTHGVHTLTFNQTVPCNDPNARLFTLLRIVGPEGSGPYTDDWRTSAEITRVQATYDNPNDSGVRTLNLIGNPYRDPLVQFQYRQDFATDDLHPDLLGEPGFMNWTVDWTYNGKKAPQLTGQTVITCE